MRQLPFHRESGGKAPLHIVGMFGIGDCLHQRGPLKELMKQFDVSLATPHVLLYHDLIGEGLRLVFRPTRLRAQAKTIEREKGLYDWYGPPRSNHGVQTFYYNKPEIDKFGSIARALYGVVNLPIPEQPDFSLPIRPEWREQARKLIDGWNTDKPILVYRPIVLRREWDGSKRNPDPAAYEA